MPESCTHVYIHYVWATWDRMPLITAALERPIYECVGKKCQELRCELLEIGGTDDHVHCLIRLHATVSVAMLAHGMKGASSHLITHVFASGHEFKWQGSYGAFSVSPGELEPVRAYVRQQKEHHSGSTTRWDWERSAETDRR